VLFLSGTNNAKTSQVLADGYTAKVEARPASETKGSPKVVFGALSFGGLALLLSTG
jgi:hypothetical protein